MRHNQLGLAIIALTLLVWAGAHAASSVQVDNRVLGHENDGRNWQADGRTFSEQRFSPLTRINDGNIGRLGSIVSP